MPLIGRELIETCSFLFVLCKTAEADLIEPAEIELSARISLIGREPVKTFGVPLTFRSAGTADLV